MPFLSAFVPLSFPSFFLALSSLVFPHSFSTICLHVYSHFLLASSLFLPFFPLALCFFHCPLPLSSCFIPLSLFCCPFFSRVFFSCLAPFFPLFVPFLSFSPSLSFVSVFVAPVLPHVLSYSFSLAPCLSTLLPFLFFFLPFCILCLLFPSLSYCFSLVSSSTFSRATTREQDAGCRMQAVPRNRRPWSASCRGSRLRLN